MQTFGIRGVDDMKHYPQFHLLDFYRRANSLCQNESLNGIEKLLNSKTSTAQHTILVKL